MNTKKVADAYRSVLLSLKEAGLSADDARSAAAQKIKEDFQDDFYVKIVESLKSKSEIMNTDVAERISSFFEWCADSDNWRWITVTQAMNEAGYTTPSRSQTTQAGKIIRKLNGHKFRRTKSARLLLVPPSKQTPIDEY